MPKKMAFTFGWELEAIAGALENMVPKEVQVGSDGSVSGESLEYKLHEDYVDDPQVGIAALRKLVSLPRLAVNKSCGFHVHIGLKDKQLRRLWGSWFITLGKAVEKYAFQAVLPSRRENSYCRKWENTHIREGVLSYRYSGSKGSNDHRYQWVNPVEMFRPGGIRTIEIRLMGETKRYLYLLAWVGACFSMARAAFRLMDDPSRLDWEADNLRVVFESVKEIMKNSIPFEQAVKLTNDLARKVELFKPTTTTAWEQHLENEMKFHSRQAEERRFEEYHKTAKAAGTGRVPYSGCFCPVCSEKRAAKKKVSAANSIWNTLHDPVPVVAVPSFVGSSVASNTTDNAGGF